jgi:hypothetical protein
MRPDLHKRRRTVSGPPPKRAAQRRRLNKPAVPVESAPGAAHVEVPTANAKWHPVAKRWFDSLALSGQSAFYEPSDWATAYVVAESISRELKPVCIGHTLDGVPVMAAVPPRGATVAAWLKAMTALMATEGDRRRMRLELNRPAPTEESADVSELDEYRRRLQSS